MKRFISLLVLVMVAMAAMAQGGRVVRGVVLDRDNRPIANATVSAVGAEDSVATGSDGSFTITVPTYTREVQASFEGYHSMKLEVDGSHLIFKLKADSNYAKAKEQARIAAEQAAIANAKAATQARLAAEKRAEAERLAAEKEAAAKAKAEKEALSAAEKQAEEQARIAAEKEATAKAKAEKEAVRLAQREVQRKSKPEAVSTKKDNFFVSFNIAIPNLKHTNMGFGPMLGWSRKVGVYTKLSFSKTPDFINSKPGYDAFYSGEYRLSHNAVTAGILIKLWNPIYLYTGVGGTWGNVVCESALSGKYYNALKYTKVGIDGGILFRIKMLTFNGGVLYTPTMGCSCNIGVGVCF